MASKEEIQPPDKINADSDQQDELNELEENTEQQLYRTDISQLKT